MIMNVDLPSKKDNDMGVYFDGDGFWFYVSSTTCWNLAREFVDKVKEIDNLEEEDDG